VALAGCSLALGVQGWPIDRLWLYLVGSALLVLVGVQLMVSWVVMRTLHELADRQRRVESDLAPPPPQKET
jgi:hypothetical protein